MIKITLIVFVCIAAHRAHRLSCEVRAQNDLPSMEACIVVKNRVEPLLEAKGYKVEYAVCRKQGEDL